MDKKAELEKLIARNKELHEIVFQSFETNEELNEYSLIIAQKLQEYRSNKKKIEELKWEQMSPQERKKETELLKKMKKKRSGNSLI